MAYSVTCPVCQEINGGSMLRCVKCQASLIGIPREQDGALPASLKSIESRAEVRSKYVREKLVRNPDQMAVSSLQLGFLTASAMLFLMFWPMDDRYQFFAFFNFYCSLPAGFIFGLVSVITGSNALRSKTEEKTKALLGIILGGTAVMVAGLPFARILLDVFRNLFHS